MLPASPLAPAGPIGPGLPSMPGRPWNQSFKLLITQGHPASKLRMFSDVETDDALWVHKASPVRCQSIMTPFPCSKQNVCTETVSPISDVSNSPPSFPFYPLVTCFNFSSHGFLIPSLLLVPHPFRLQNYNLLPSVPKWYRGGWYLFSMYSCINKPQK